MMASLRANGSRECAPMTGSAKQSSPPLSPLRAEQSHGSAERTSGLLRGACHRAALRADPLARNGGKRRYDFAFSRRDPPEVFPKVSRLEIRGRGECRMRAAPAVPCAKWEKETHTSRQVQRRHSDIPCAMALRLTSRSPRRIGLCCLRRLRIWPFPPGRADRPPKT